MSISKNNEEAVAQRVAANVREWATINIITDVLGKRARVFDAQAAALQELYIYRTNTLAWNFAKGLLKAVIGEITSLESEVDTCASRLASATEAFNRAIADRCNDEGLSDLQQQLVKFYSPEAVKDFTKSSH